ncbi:leucine export protein LeuE [Caloramator mitchellensis]|uniref:Leucine export protein LeuE n=1 Tax=Caloramator mitchellensis TaxID=908809 RepID=A0A0R3JRQ2_CALMK|nr:LysE family transporter [Caloramator mitchellensis]KRQ86166.1 leucine export protein LeuE [Caloramator mitchellensis]
MNYLIRGFIVGFSVAAPVGPIGVLCIQRSLSKGKKSGFFSGLGAATADAIYGFIAAFGLTFISNFLIRQRRLIGLLGGVFLIYLGIKTFISNPAEKPEKTNEGEKFIDDYLSTFLLTLTNPMTIMSFLAIFAGLGLSREKADYASATTMVTGVFLGSTTWWFLLSNGVNIFKEKINIKALKIINILSGTAIISFGIFAVFKLFFRTQ